MTATPERRPAPQPAGQPALDPDLCLSVAERMLAEVPRGARGAWPRACAWLIRIALETELTRFWQAIREPVARCRSRQAQFLLLRAHLGRAAAVRAHQTWAVLSRAGHHHSYELALTAVELDLLRRDAAEAIAALRAALAADPRDAAMRSCPPPPR